MTTSEPWNDKKRLEFRPCRITLVTLARQAEYLHLTSKVLGQAFIVDQYHQALHFQQSGILHGGHIM